MTDTGRLAQFERRYAAAPASPLAFLQLAEEYRRAGRFADAIRVLEPGLKEHPTYLSAQVALGRTRLEMGDGAAAAEILSEVLSKDPPTCWPTSCSPRRACAAAIRQRPGRRSTATACSTTAIRRSPTSTARIDELGGGSTGTGRGGGGRRRATVKRDRAPPAPPCASATAAGDRRRPVAPRVGTGEPFASAGLRSATTTAIWPASPPRGSSSSPPRLRRRVPLIPPVPPVAPNGPGGGDVGRRRPSGGSRSARRRGRWPRRSPPRRRARRPAPQPPRPSPARQSPTARRR